MAGYEIDDKYLIDLLEKLVNTPSVFPGEEDVMLFLEKELRRIGLPAKRIPISPGRFNLLCRLGSGDPVLCLNAHSDTVPVSGESTPEARISEGVMYGLGSADDKASVASMIAAMKAVGDSGMELKGSLDLLISVDEEGDAFGVRTAVSAGYTCDFVVTGEPSCLDIVPAHCGLVFLDLVTHGKATHGSLPMDGINAVDMMYDLVSDLRAVVTDYPAHELIGPPTLNLGMLNGGDRPNRVPDRCEASVDIRVVPPMSVEGVLAKIEKFFESWKGKAEYSVAKQGNPLNTPLDSKLIGALKCATNTVCGASTKVVGWRGWTEAEPFQTVVGADAAVLGAGSLKQAHSANEFVDLEQVKKAARIYVETAKILLAESAQ